ncbi:MAG: hypothetical protein H6738_09100 [Alphaproteobacteria bacterium]|nr:hypothetical protein [Alphaproteobacteria bacterium]MCB9696919.1 hypothetical protein [Alphaproteobacteria bacterium]
MRSFAATLALTLLPTTAFAESPLEPAYMEILVVDAPTVEVGHGEVDIRGTLIDASCGDGRVMTVCGTGQVFVIFLDGHGVPESGWFGEVLDASLRGDALSLTVGGTGAAHLTRQHGAFTTDGYEVADRAGLVGAVAHLDERGNSVWAVEGTTLTHGQLVTDLGRDCWITVDDDGVRAEAFVDGSDVRGIWGTGGVAIWGTGGVAVWGPGVKSDTETLWGTEGVPLDAIWGTGGVAIWGTGGVAIWGTGGVAVPWPGASGVFGTLTTHDAPTLAARGLAVHTGTMGAVHMDVTPL